MKYAFVKDQSGNYSVTSLCRALKVSRSGFYNWCRRQPSQRDLANKVLVGEIAGIHKETMHSYGSPRMHVELTELGYKASLGRIERLMNKNELAAKQGKRNKQRQKNRTGVAPVANILDRQFMTDLPNTKWVSDITFIENPATGSDQRGINWTLIGIMTALISAIVIALINAFVLRKHRGILN